MDMKLCANTHISGNLRSLFFGLFLFFTAFLMFPVQAYAMDAEAWSEETGITFSTDGKQHVYDVSGQLSSGQIDELENLAKEYGEKQNLDYMILITDKLSEVEIPASESIRRPATEKLSEDFYTFSQASNAAAKDCAILTIFYPGVKGQNYVDVSGQGAIKEKLDNSRCLKVVDEMKPDLTDGNLYGASVTFIKTVDRYIKVRPGISPDFFLLKLPFQLLIGFLLALIIILIMIHNSGGKVTVTQNTYLDAKSPGVIGRYDRFVRKTVTKRKIETSSGSHSSGGSSGGGGGSHGGSSF